MNIGTVADLVRMPAKTIRYYDDIGLVIPARAQNGYRDYSNGDVHRLRFLQRARSSGITVEDCRLILSLYGHNGRSSAEVKSIALAKVSDIERKLVELRSLRNALIELIDCCNRDNRPDCPIFNDRAPRYVS